MNVEHLVNMVEQIARNFAVRGEDAAMVATAEHIRLYWDSRMKAALVGGDGSHRSSVVRGVIQCLRE